MSLAAISQALETRLAAMTPALATAWENVTFTPTAGTPYQRVNFMPATPNDYGVASGTQEIGLFQVMLCYPLNTGRAAAAARVQLLRDQFPRNLRLLSGSALVAKIMRTPAAAPGMVDGDRWVVPVTIRWSDR